MVALEASDRAWYLRAMREPTSASGRSFAVFTSGGDAPGMNAAVRAVVRAAAQRGVDLYAIHEGFQGMVDGGDAIRPLGWSDVGGILQLGGTIIGSARCAEFRERGGRRRAAKNLLARGIDGLVIIGGDGSLTGGYTFRQEWPELLRELVASGEVPAEVAARHPHLQVVGLVGSIDNDMFGTDMTIGADTALHRIVEAIDTITSTASSHHRTFVVEVMGRNCGYLALMSGLATGANWVLIPECPPEGEDWEGDMVRTLSASQEAGRRHGIIIVAEGARDRNGRPLSSHYVKEVLEHRLGADTRITILGHVQRGGAPSAFDRHLSTILGYEAVHALLETPPDGEPQLVGLRANRVSRVPLMEAVKKTHDLAAVIERHDYPLAMDMRGGSFREAQERLRMMQRTRPHEAPAKDRPRRILILHVGGAAPGMNTVVRAATRLALESGHEVYAARSGFKGLLDGRIERLGWMSVHGWVGRGGAELGTSRRIPRDTECVRLGEILQREGINAMLIVGGWAGYKAAHRMYQHRNDHPGLDISVCCVPASINNNLPGSEQSIGADTALNSIVTCVDQIKQSAVASHRCFIVEVMGRDCGYLGLLSGLATGAERVYIPEDSIQLDAVQADLRRIAEDFRQGKRLALIVRSEQADSTYTTDFIARVFEKEGGFDVRKTILGHLQQGGNPTPYDRIQAIRLAAHAVQKIEASPDESFHGAIGLQRGKVTFTGLEDLSALADGDHQRPRDQQWLGLREIVHAMAVSPGADRHLD